MPTSIQWHFFFFFLDLQKSLAELFLIKARVCVRGRGRHRAERKVSRYQSNSGFYLPKGYMYLKLMIYFSLTVHLDLSRRIENFNLTYISRRKIV